LLHGPRRHVGVRTGRYSARHHPHPRGAREPGVWRAGPAHALLHRADVRLYAASADARGRAPVEPAVKRVLLERFGVPEESVRCADGPDVGAPDAGEVVFDVLAFPINPADVSFCRGTYRLKPALPAT